MDKNEIVVARYNENIEWCLNLNFIDQIIIINKGMPLENNKNRERVVPEYVIHNMYKSFQFPLYTEGWNKISVVNIFSEYKDPVSKIVELRNFSQDNSYHTLSLGKHMEKSLDLYKGNYPYAAWLHDIGKEHTKSFVKKDGTVDTNAHYYGHENISAYEVRNQFPRLPLVMWIHGVIPYLEQPPFIDLNISKFLVNFSSNLTLCLNSNSSTNRSVEILCLVNNMYAPMSASISSFSDLGPS
jgi:hypothetical protein